MFEINNKKELAKAIEIIEDLNENDLLDYGYDSWHELIDMESIEDELVGNGDHHIEKRAIIELDGKYFEIYYDGVGKDLDEYVNFTHPREVKRKEVVQIVYV